MPCPAMLKGQMKWPRKGLQSTTPEMARPSFPRPPCAPSIHHPVMPGLIADDNNKDDNNKPRPAYIDDIDNESIANMFCFGAFANKNTGVVYNDCTGNFSFMLLDGNVCFFCNVPLQNKHHLCHTNPWTRFAKYPRRIQKNFEFLVCKGYTPKINLMDNQATKAIKSYLTPQQCHLQLVEPGNHRINAAELAIQTFKN